MPFRTEYFAREVSLECGGVVIYHDYKKDGTGIRYEYHFTLSDADDAHSFDVRHLSAWADFKDRPRMSEEQKISLTLKRSIMRNELPTI